MNKSFWIFSLLQIANGTFNIILWSLTLKPKIKPIYIIGINIIPMFLFSLPKTIGDIGNSTIGLVYSISTMIYLMLVAVCFFRERTSRKILMGIMTLAVCMSGEMMTVMTLSALHLKQFSMDLDFHGMLAGATVALINIIFVEGLLFIAWKKFMEKNRIKVEKYYFLWFASWELFEFYYLNQYSSVPLNVVSYAGIFLYTVCGIAWFWILYRQSMKHSLEEEILQLKMLMDKELGYYHTLEEKEALFSKLRHDWNNHLTVLHHMIQAEGEQKDAEDMLRDLKNRINGKDTKMY